jgi:hypothetical protein
MAMETIMEIAVVIEIVQIQMDTKSKHMKIIFLITSSDNKILLIKNLKL